VTLKDEINAIVKSAVGDMGEIRGKLSELEHSLPHVHRWTGDIRQIMMTLATRLTSLTVVAAKEVMIGNVEPATKQDRTEEMPLFAGIKLVTSAAVPPDRMLLLRSLHRAGDHTLDEEEGAQ